MAFVTEGFFFYSFFNSIAHHPFSLCLILSFSTFPSLFSTLLMHEKKFLLQKQFYQRQIEMTVTWYGPLAQVISNFSRSSVPLLIGTWVRDLLEINHYLNLFPSSKGFASFSSMPLFQNIDFGIYFNYRNVLILYYIKLLEICATVSCHYVLWHLQYEFFHLRVLPPMTEINYCKSPLLTTKTLTGSLPEWHLNLPGAWTCQCLQQVPEPDTSWRHWEQSGGWWCWWWGLLGFMLGEIVTWCCSPLPFPTVALNHHSVAPLAN